MKGPLGWSIYDARRVCTLENGYKDKCGVRDNCRMLRLHLPLEDMANIGNHN
jgi:hypothetical protein